MTCVANGCKQPGGIQYGGDWICRYHHKVNPRKWGEVTLMLNTTLKDEISLLNQFDHMCIVDLSKCGDHSGTKKVPREGDIFEYVETLRAYINQQIRGRV